jgi:hypothetical protein
MSKEWDDLCIRSSNNPKLLRKIFTIITLQEIMNWMLKLITLFILTIFSSGMAQSVIKVLQFDNHTGIIDKGEDAGLHVGDVFDVNRYAGDFVYWIGRVEVIVVKPKVAGVKMIAQAENGTIQQGDWLELRRRDAEPTLEKKNQPAVNDKKNDALPLGKIEPAALSGAAISPLRAKKVIFGLTSGFSQPFKNSSQSFGLNFSVAVRSSDDDDDDMKRIDLTHAYTTSIGLQVFCTLPLSERLAVNLSYDYVPMNVKSEVESMLLNYGLTASASLMKLSAALESRIYQNFHAGLGAGLFVPQVVLKDGRQSLTLAERRLGFAANAAHLLPLGPAAWLKSILEYNIFLDDGPAIHYLTLQTGLSIGIGKP